MASRGNTAWRTIGLALALGCALVRAAAASEARPALGFGAERRYTAEEQALMTDAADGRWDRHSLLSAVLVAEGHAGSPQTERYAALIEDWTGEISALSAGRPAEEQARIALAFLHRRILTGRYEETASSLIGAVEGGNYNCLSSTILFELLAARLGIEVWAVELPSHVFVRARLDGRTFDVETTTPRISPSDSVASLAASQAREIGAVELVAIVFYNRGIDLLERGDFAGAVAANRGRGLRLDPSHRAARKNLIAAWNNWAVDLVGRGDLQPAATVLEQGLESSPEDELLAANLVAIHRQWIDGLCDAGQFGHAARLLDEFAAQRPHEPYYRAKRSELSGVVGTATP